MLWRSSRATRVRTLVILAAIAAIGLGSVSSAGAQASSVTATFAPVAGVLNISGNDLANSIVVSVDPTGQILVNGGQVPIAGGTPTVSNTVHLLIYGLGGDDEITLVDISSSTPLPPATVFGGSGNDTITGGLGPDHLFGEDGDDTIRGGFGADEIFGGAGNDVLTGGLGNDVVLGEAGNDRTLWNPGDGSDFDEGGDGTDSLEFNGGSISEIIAVSANAGRVKLDRNVGLSTQDIGTTESLVVNAGAGSDTVAATDGLAGLIKLTFYGGLGDDILLGSDGPDVLNGGEGNDTILGNGGNDSVFMGAGDDVFIWEPGDGNDIVEGEADRDTFRFNGTNEDENVDVSARGTRVRFFRDVANITADLNGIEVVEFDALGGIDTVSVKDLTPTDALDVVVNLEQQPGQGDSAPDSVTVNGTAVADTILISGQSGSYTVAGLRPTVRVVGSEATDQLVVTALGGDDAIEAGNLLGDVVKLTIDGGSGNDVIHGGRGDDTLLGGTGNDTFTWNPGDRNDTIDGQGGGDTLKVNGSATSEATRISANGAPLLIQLGHLTDLRQGEVVGVQA